MPLCVTAEHAQLDVFVCYDLVFVSWPTRQESWSSQQWQLRARCQSSALVPPTPPPPPPPPVVAPPPPPTNQQPSKRLACNKFAIGGPSKTKIAKWNRSMVRLAKHKAKLVKERIAATASNSSATADPPDRPRTAEPPDQHVWEV